MQFDANVIEICDVKPCIVWNKFKILVEYCKYLLHRLVGRALPGLEGPVGSHVMSAVALWSLVTSHMTSVVTLLTY